VSKTIALVSCVKSKYPGPLPAEELYCSDWFKKTSAYAKKSVNEWHVLKLKTTYFCPMKQKNILSRSHFSNNRKVENQAPFLFAN